MSVALFDAFAQSKRRYVEQLEGGLAETRQDRLLGKVLRLTGHDPLPYGLEPNRAVLGELLEHARNQHILPRPVALEDVFAADTLTLRV